MDPAGDQVEHGLPPCAEPVQPHEVSPPMPSQAEEQWLKRLPQSG
jgi:hypothetical protein